MIRVEPCSNRWINGEICRYLAVSALQPLEFLLKFD